MFQVLVLASLGTILFAQGVILWVTRDNTRKVRTLMGKIEDLTAAVTDLQEALVPALDAIDAEIKQLSDLVASGGLTPEASAAVQASIDNITAVATALRTATTKLAADDTPPTP
jgi:hypothetical protein